MPRYPESYSDTPFAQMLTSYMWSKTPPWNVPRLATFLGVQRNRVSNWVFNDIVPEIDTMLSVLAKLNIPVSKLLDAYAAAGLPVPPLTEADASARAAAQPTEAATMSIPPARRGRGGGVGHRAGQLTSQPAPTPEQEWDIMVAHTRKIMTEAGMPLTAVNAMLAELEQRRAGQPSAAQRRIHEEMREEQPEEKQEEAPSDARDEPGADPAPRRNGAPSR